MSKKKRPKATATPPAPQVAAAPAPRRRRRRRRRTNQLLSQRLVTEVNQKKRTFLRDVSQMLTDALGFEVRVTLVRPKVDLSPDQRRAARMTKAQSRRQMADSMVAPIVARARILPGTKRAGIPGLDDGIGDL